jgi:hypothetical protein
MLFQYSLYNHDQPRCSSSSTCKSVLPLPGQGIRKRATATALAGPGQRRQYETDSFFISSFGLLPDRSSMIMEAISASPMGGSPKN